MYNFSIDTVPPFLPVLTEVQLKPWFPRQTLEAGLELIREGRFTAFHVLRNCVGGCIDDEATVTLQFEKSAKLSQGFVLKNNFCGLCGHEAQRNRCAHMAALALLGMVELPDAHKPRPISLAYAESHWRKTGETLYDWLGKTKYEVQRSRQEENERWRIIAGEHLLEAWLPPSVQELAGHLCTGVPGDGGEVVSRLLNELKLLTMTPGERQLDEAGSIGKAWKRDTSFWSWLTGILFICHNGTVPELAWNPDISACVLKIGEPETPGAFSLTLPREKTWSFVRNIPFPEQEVTILPKARECYRVFFNDTNQVEVRPSLRREDGEVVERQELDGVRLDGAWYLPDAGFLPVSRIAGEGQLRNPEQKVSSLGLLSFLQTEETREDAFTVAPDTLQRFLDENRPGLLFPDNEIDPALLDLKFCEIPDRLIIDGFEKRDGGALLSCRFGIDTASISLADIHNAINEGMTHLPGKTWLKLVNTPLSWFHELIKEQLATQEAPCPILLSNMELFRLVGMLPEVEIDVEEPESREYLDGLLDVERWTETGILTGIPEHLRPYQANGLAWLTRLTRFGIGGLLADDMGLGKTHQGLALLQMLLRDNRHTRALIICPASVVLHWAEKIDRYYPDIDYGVYYGPRRSQRELVNHPVVLTTYGLVRQDAEMLADHTFDLVLLDEIQNIKNHQTASHLSVAGLQGRVFIGLTGTPVENSLEDLRALFSVCLPGLLGSEKHFARHYAKPITEQNSNGAQKRLSRLIDPFILRRTRSQVLGELPDVIEDERFCELSSDQAGLYQEVLENRIGQLSVLSDETQAIPYMHVLSTLIRLKQVCCHPCLIDGSRDPEQYACGKWDLFTELSRELLESGIKFVVFSQYLGMLEMMENHFRNAGVGVAGLRGSMRVDQRQRMIDRFNTDPDCRVFCASLMAGGVGIDLTGARAVIHYDRWWNPAKEEQATARVHRMGQKNVVQVFHLITLNTLEERIHNLLQEKRQLSDAVIREDEASIIKQMSREQLAGLLRGMDGI